jgi:hypothetical protein
MPEVAHVLLRTQPSSRYLQLNPDRWELLPETQQAAEPSRPNVASESKPHAPVTGRTSFSVTLRRFMSTVQRSPSLN